MFIIFYLGIMDIEKQSMKTFERLSSKQHIEDIP